MKALLVFTAALALCGCDKLLHKPTSDDSESLILGTGGYAKMPGVAVLVGPANVRFGTATVPIYVQTAPPFVEGANHNGLTCLVFDENKRLVASGGGTLPPQYMGGTIHIDLPRAITGGSVQCRAVHVL